MPRKVLRVAADLSGSMVKRRGGRPPRINAIVPALQALRQTIGTEVDALGVYLFSTTGAPWPDAGNTDLLPMSMLDGLTVESILKHPAKGGGSRIADAINVQLDEALAGSVDDETRVVVLCDGAESGSACGSNATKRQALTAKILAAKARGISVSIVGVVDKKDEARVRGFAEQLGVEVVIHAHCDDSATAGTGSFADAAANVTKTITIMFQTPSTVEAGTP